MEIVAQINMRTGIALKRIINRWHLTASLKYLQMKKLNNYLMVLLMAIVTLTSACYKYTAEPNYATLKGSFVDGFTNSNLDVGSITLSPAKSVNGSMNLDTSGRFTNTKILPGTYKVYGSIKAAFKTDSLSIDLAADKATEVKLTIEPWISVSSYLLPVTDTTATIRFKIQGNRGMVPARHLVSWSSTPAPTVTVYTNPTNSRYFVTPASGGENGVFTYKIVGLKWNTVYFVRAGARTNDPVLNPANDYNYGRQIIFKTPNKQ